MAEYDPPIYDVSIFNPAYFIVEDGITKSYLSANYLEFPIGQGLETLPDLRVENTNIHLGTNAGVINQDLRAIAIGDYSGAVNQGNSSIALGNYAGNDNQQSGAVAIGLQSGQNNQGANSVAIGSYAGYSGGNLGADSVAIGNAARATGTDSVSIGHSASTSTYTNSVAIGNGATCFNNNEVKLSNKASFLGNGTHGWSFGDVGVGANWAGLQHIGYARDGTKYALLQNNSIGSTALGGVSRINLNVGNSLKAYLLPSGSGLGAEGLHISTAGISYDGTTQPTGGNNNLIGFRWKASTLQVGVGVDNVVGGYFTTISDRRAKKNIVDYTDGLTDIMKLKPKQYEIIKVDVAKCDFQDNNCIIRDLSGNTIEYDSEGNCCDETETYGEKQTGLILDEVRQIFPSVVEGGDENSLGTINYAGLVPMLVKAVQQLKMEIEALKNP